MADKKRTNSTSMVKSSFSSGKQIDSYRTTKSWSAVSTSPFSSKTLTPLSIGQKNSTQTFKTYSNSNNGYKSPTSNVPSFKETASKTNDLLTAQKKQQAFKTNANYKEERHGFINTFKTQPSNIIGPKCVPHTFTTYSNLYTGPENPRPAFKTISKWPTAHPITAPAFKVYPTFNNFPRSNTPAHLLGEWDSRGDQLKDGVLKSTTERGRSSVPSQKNDDNFLTRNQQSALTENNRHRTNRGSRDTNENELNCPTCEATFLPKIYQCTNGHSSCSSCKEKAWPCGICAKVITDTRNYALEEYLSEKSFLCPHNVEGCDLVMNISEIYAHVEECPFKILECPAGCSSKVSLKQLPKHFDDQHPGQLLAGCGCEVELRYIYEPSQKVYLIQVGAFSFLFHEYVSDDSRIYMAAQLIGTKVNASKWFYEVHIYAKNEPHRVSTFSEICTSYIEPVFDVFNEGKCCILTQKHAATFLYQAAVHYKIFIKQMLESKPMTPEPVKEFLLINLDD